ncbi:unnamed protein product [Dicrocoelium dendriticum]|nr:unnamed protein product [Dicrocoelium dendriticum]
MRLRRLRSLDIGLGFFDVCTLQSLSSVCLLQIGTLLSAEHIVGLEGESDGTLVPCFRDGCDEVLGVGCFTDCGETQGELGILEHFVVLIRLLDVSVLFCTRFAWHCLQTVFKNSLLMP